MSSTSSHRQDDEGDDQDKDERFFRSYSKALAEALLEQEQQNQNTTTSSISKEEVIHEAYAALCHDDPRVTSDQACRYLASCLTHEEHESLVPSQDESKTEKKYALSDRLVDGICQATERFEPNNNNVMPPAQQDENETENEEEALSFATGGTATAAGYAALAYAVFAEVPLLCCQCSNQTSMQRYLGSYQGPQREIMNDDEDEAIVEEEPPTTTTTALPPFANGSHNTNNDHDLLEEVWADESDPDDYEYESEYMHQNDADDAWAAFDPIALSQPSSSLDVTRLRHAVCNLLSELTYTKLAPLSTQQWKTLHVSDTLTQLTLTLLVEVPPDQQEGNSSSLLLEDAVSAKELRHLGTQPLFCLRDRAMDKSRRYDALDDYLALLQMLLTVDRTLQQQQSASTKEKQPLVPATVLGLTCLSALCTSSRDLVTTGSKKAAAAPPTRIRQCVLQNVEELANIVEQVSPTTTTKTAQGSSDGDESSSVPLWVRLILTLLPQLSLLTNIQANGTRLPEPQKQGASRGTSSSEYSVSNTEAQLIMNSGFFRELVLLYTRTAANDDDKDRTDNTTSSSSCSVARMELVRAILVLCVTSPPNLLTKYAWRVPEFSSLLWNDETFRKQQPVDFILWTLLGGVTLAGGGGDGASTTTSRLRLRPPQQQKQKQAAATTTTTASTIPPPTVETCRESCLETFHRLCSKVTKAFCKLREIRESADNNDADTTTAENMEDDNFSSVVLSWKKQYEETVMEFVRFTNLLVSCPSVATMWWTVATLSPSVSSSVMKSVQDVRDAVSSMPPRRKVERNESSSGKTAENDKLGSPSSGRERLLDAQEEDVASVRKGVKVLLLLLQEERPTSDAAVNPNSRTNVSSKTD